MVPLTTLVGLAAIFAGFVVTAMVRARKLGDAWEPRGLGMIFGGFGLIMAGVILAIATV
jgi:hypothetical protein